VRIRYAAILVFLSLSPVSPTHQASPKQAEDTQRPQIAVRMSVLKRSFHVGEPVLIDVRVSNVGKEPVIVGNDVSVVSGAVSRLEFKLRDIHGHLSPSTQMISDNFGSRPTNDDIATKLLASFVLLRPGNSLVVRTAVDSVLFALLSKPGTYQLSATYASGGLEYPPMYHRLGLTDEAVKSLPYRSWTGKVSMNTVSFEVVASK
jgi:hypothetical protein